MVVFNGVINYVRYHIVNNQKVSNYQSMSNIMNQRPTDWKFSKLSGDLSNREGDTFRCIECILREVEWEMHTVDKCSNDIEWRYKGENFEAWGAL